MATVHHPLPIDLGHGNPHCVRINERRLPTSLHRHISSRLSSRDICCNRIAGDPDSQPPRITLLLQTPAPSTRKDSKSRLFTGVARSAPSSRSTVPETRDPADPDPEEASSTVGSDAVQAFYSAINDRNLEEAVEHIAQSCVYEDLIYSRPFVGKPAVKAHFQNVLSAIPRDMAFVIDNITAGAGADVGMTWHAELDGRELPFSRGCSFYRCALEEGKWRIAYARDIPEPATKPGNVALSILSAASFLLRRLPK